LSFAANQSRLLAIGDVHGCFTALTALWQMVQPSEQDTVVFLGDYVDRGPESREVLDWLIRESAKPNRIFLRGNHEVMMLSAAENPFQAESWRSCGGLETLMSYALRSGFDWASRIPDTHWAFLQKTTRYYETEKHIFVHACLDGQLDLDEQLEDVLYWQTFEQLWPHKSGKKVVCGHTTLSSGEIADVGHGVCIETAVAYGGWLTCLDVNSGQFWQSNQEGKSRSGEL
jgi:serine/threonine protein phosphatase 1